MDLKVELEFTETQESKYRKNAAVQIAQEVENVIRHAKMNAKTEETSQTEESGTTEKKAEHIADLNEQMRKLGIGYLIEEGCVRRTIYIALKDMGIKRPYPLEGGVDNEERSASRKRVDNRMQEFVWAFGSDTEDQIERQITNQIKQLKRHDMNLQTGAEEVIRLLPEHHVQLIGLYEKTQNGKRRKAVIKTG